MTVKSVYGHCTVAGIGLKSKGARPEPCPKKESSDGGVETLGKITRRGKRSQDRRSNPTADENKLLADASRTAATFDLDRHVREVVSKIPADLRPNITASLSAPEIAAIARAGRKSKGAKGRPPVPAVTPKQRRNRRAYLKRKGRLKSPGG